MAIDNVIQYITIASTGNAQDFGDLSGNRTGSCGLASTTRGVIAGGGSAYAEGVDIIEYVTIASTGNMTDFGNLLVGKYKLFDGGTSNSTRGIIAGGAINTDIEYITIASTGNAADFGDCTVSGFAKYANAGGDRAVIAGGVAAIDEGSNRRDTIDYITITSTGNATDFGDLSDDKFKGCSMSSGHGGL